MKISLVKSVKERQDERAVKVAEIEKVKADAGKANSVPALRLEVQRLAEIVEKLMSRC